MKTMSGDLREYRWVEINEALMDTKHSASRIWDILSALIKVIGKDVERTRDGEGVSDNMKKYSWNELNQALMATGHSTPWICRILFALNRVKRNSN